MAMLLSSKVRPQWEYRYLDTLGQTKSDILRYGGWMPGKDANLHGEEAFGYLASPPINGVNLEFAA